MAQETTAQQQEQPQGIIELCNGTTEDGTKFYAYILVRPDKYMEFKQKIQSGEAIKFEEYGEIIAAGEGEEPPEDVKNAMEEQFGADHNFMQKVEDEIKRLVENPTEDDKERIAEMQKFMDEQGLTEKMQAEIEKLDLNMDENTEGNA